LPRTVRLIAGYALVAAALGLLASAQLLFRQAGQNPIPWKPTPSLEFSGPYRFTRNPMYVGMTLMQVGLGVLLDNLWILVLAGPALAIVHVIAVLPEEAYLSEKFGEPYRHYLSKVRRYL
jgi:protein-S-isoprenylcysteine O-methyltransferase Ste14